MANEVNVMFKRGLLGALPATYEAGTFYVTTDEPGLYLDVDNSTRIRFGDFQEFATLDALKANTNPSTTALYYITNLNCLAKWNGTEYVQINLDTGMTSVEVSGEGNALINPVYDPTTRKLTFTATTLATADDITAASDELKEYVDEKTKDIASGTAFSELGERVTTAEGEIDALQEKVGEKAVGTQIDEKITALDLGNTYEAKGTAATEAGKVQDALDEYIEANDAAVKAADDKAAAAQTAVGTLAGKVGTVPADKTVVQMISEAQTAATYDDTKVKEDIQANADAIALLNDASTVEGSVDYKIAQAVAAIVENPDDTMNSINELVTWINDHADDALELSNKVTANEQDIAALEGLVGSTAVATQITDAIAAALKIEGVDKYALASDLTAAIGRIAVLEGKVATWDAAEQNAKDYADGLNTAMDNRVKALEAIDHDAYVDADAEVLADAKDYADGLAGNYDATGSAAAAEAAAKAYTDEQITANILVWGSF